MVLISLLAIGTAFNSEGRVYSGLEVFLGKHTDMVKGKRVGLITNQTGADADRNSTIDLFHRDPRIRLVALFAPEHGIRGNLKAGANVPGGKDPSTGLPVYTLYGGQDHRPTKEALGKIDVLVYDIQDVGSRDYTYIWHLAECMSAAAENGKEVIVLDRPNPYGAVTVDGPVTEKKFLSFIGLYPIPRVYGMTVGELACYLNTEEKIGCRLTIIPMRNYQRGMTWDQTGLPWIPPSPNIPNLSAAYCFAATGTIGESGALNIGCGSKASFQMLATSWIDLNFTSAKLNSLKLPGVKFMPATVESTKGKISGVLLSVTNPSTFRPSTTETAILCHLRKYYPDKFSFMADGNRDRLNRFDKAEGTSSVRNGVNAGLDYTQIATSWKADQDRFCAKTAKYRIYK